MKNLWRSVCFTTLPLFLAGSGLPTKAAGGQGPANTEQSTSDQLRSIEQRLSNLEATPRFEVVDKGGKVMFSVGPRQVNLYSPNRSLRFTIVAHPEGAMFGATDGKSLVRFRATDEEGGMTIEEGGLRMTFGIEEAKNYSLKFPAGKIGALAGIGDSEAGSGALIVGNREGELKAGAGLFREDGAFTIYNGDGNGVALLTKSVNGGGALDLTDHFGSTLVLMKTNDNRYGVVSVFPPGLPYIPSSGVPGTYLLGCAGGKECQPYK